MKKQGIYVIRGIGIGFILASIFFFSLKHQMIEQTKTDISEAEIIERAQALGMIKITQVEEVYLTDEEVIEKAMELGMEFKQQGNDSKEP